MAEGKVYTFTDLFKKELEKKLPTDTPEEIQVSEPFIIKPIYLDLQERLIYLKKHDLLSWSCNEDALSQNTSTVHILEQFPELINWEDISGNRNAMHLIRKNMDKIDWESLSLNQGAVDILESNIDKVDWYNLALNPKAIHLIEKYLHIFQHENFHIVWRAISANSAAIHILEQNIDKIYWCELFENTRAMHLIQMSVQLDDQFNYEKTRNDEFDYDRISLFTLNLWSNPSAIHLLEKIFKHVDWRFFSKNPNGIHLIEKNLDKVHWDTLSTNPKAIHILQKNLDKVHWYEIFRNPEAMPIISMFFPLDYKKMHEHTQQFRQELLSVVMNPDRISRMSNSFALSFDEYLSLYRL
jgi:hypothetical protein